MTLLMDEILALRKPGPNQWEAAVDRVAYIVRPIWRTRTMEVGGPQLLNGTAALALGIYLISRTQNVPIVEVSRQQVGDLLLRRTDDRVALWSRLVREAGHDADDPGDPVAGQWRRQLRDLTPPGVDMLSDAVYEDSLMVQIGPALGVHINRVFAETRSVEW